MKFRCLLDLSFFKKLKIGFLTTVLWLMGLLAAQSQPASFMRYKNDSTSVVKRSLALLVSRPFNNQLDSLMKNLNILMAYETYSQENHINYATPIDKRVDIYAHRAQAEWLLGMYKVALLEHYIQMESGVLPLIDTSISHLDSTVYYYGELNRYVVGQTKLVNQVDSAFAKIVSDDLKSSLEKMEQAENFDAISDFNLKVRAKNLFENIRAEFKEEFIDQSLTYWIIQGLSDERKPVELKQK